MQVVSPVILHPFRLISFFAAAAALLSPAHAQIAAWDFTGENNAATSTAEIYHANLDSINGLTRGSGANASSGSNSFRTQGFENDGISTANTDYFQTTLSAAPGYTLSLSTLDARFNGTAAFFAAPGVTAQFAYSLDGSSFTLIGSPFVMTSATSMPQIPLGGIPALQNVPANVTVTLRYYASGQTDSGGWGFTSASSGQYGFAIGGGFTAVADGIPPGLVSLTPANGSSGWITTTTASITYDEDILQNTGSIVIRKSVGSLVVETINLPSPQVTVSGATATLNPSVTLEPATAYSIDVPAGAFKDGAGNPAPAISGATSWTFTTRPAPSVVISQYYEGSAAGDRYIELKNLTAAPLPLAGYQLAVWKDSPPSDNECWKSGTGSPDGVTDLAAHTIPANGHFLIALSSATAPGYAASNHDLEISGGALSFDGDDSIVLYQGSGFTRAEVVDAFPLSASQGLDTSYYRKDNQTGFDFVTGSSATDFPDTWGQKTLEEVGSATLTDAWYLRASYIPETLALSVSTSTFSEGSVSPAATGTLTRSGSTLAPLVVSVTVGDPSEISLPSSVTIPAGSASVPVSFNAVDDAFLDGNQTVPVSFSVSGFVPVTQVFTVTDEPGDVAFPVVINEVDVDTAGTDAAEFVELYNSSGQAVPLDGVVLVFYQGSDNTSYRTVDLSEFTLAAHDFLVIGNSLVAGVDKTFPGSTLKNDANAVALYLTPASLIPNGTSVGSVVGTLLDAIVYDSNDPDNTVLLDALTSGKPQVNEATGGNPDVNSISRLPDGGPAFETSLFVVQTPTPGATNVLAPPNTFASWISTYNVGTETGMNGDFDRDGLPNAVENLLGTDPSTGNTGLTAVSATTTTLTFQHLLADTPAADLTPTYEWSANLSSWNASGATAGGATVTFGAPVVVTPGVPADLVQVTATISGTIPRLFARLKAVKP